jgi:hypothetical protein
LKLSMRNDICQKHECAIGMPIARCGLPESLPFSSSLEARDLVTAKAVQELFEDWAGLVSETVLLALKENGDATLNCLCGHFRDRSNALAGFQWKLARAVEPYGCTPHLDVSSC